MLTRTLRSGCEMPALGLGTWPIKGPKCVDLVRTGLESGFRLIDTAQMYTNEVAVGMGIEQSGVHRHDIFLTTKVLGCNQGKLTRQSVEMSLDRLGTDYLDLILIHWPNPTLGRAEDTWQTLADLQAEGLTMSIGLSNFTLAQYDALVDATGVEADLDQVQIDPWARQDELVDGLLERGVMPQAWGPLGTRAARHDAELDWTVLETVAQRHGVSPQAIALADQLSRGIATVVRSSNPEHQKANLAALDVQLTDEDKADLAAIPQTNIHVYDSTKEEEF